ncbi:MAG: hypothetical protein IK139_04030, partial [Lachnospiraceae bacterium]|nr:hypothetical protein [Lachnospiraceae bacterium]
LLDDRNNSWDLEDEKDQEIYGYIHNDLKVACDWITRSCAGYGREVEFVWDWTEHEELICDLSTDISVEGNLEYYYDDLARLIRQNVDADDIKSKNDANGIIYLACVDTPYSNQNTSSTFMSERSNPAEEEFCIMMMRTDGDIEPPSAFAHEMLHTFGAADLYMSGMYGITDELVRYFENSGSNDIMFRCEDKRTGEYYYDRITNEITEITAYYSGLTDESETVREWGLERSDYQ